jgi:hypothetical protein
MLSNDERSMISIEKRPLVSPVALARSPAGRAVRERREDLLDRGGRRGGAEAEQGGEPCHRVESAG